MESSHLQLMIGTPLRGTEDFRKKIVCFCSEICSGHQVGAILQNLHPLVSFLSLKMQVEEVHLILLQLSLCIET